MTVIVLVVVLFVFLVDLRAVGQALRTADPLALLLASVALVAGLVAYALRWRLLLAQKPTRLHTFHASNIGHAGNILLPARAGEAARIVVMGQSGAVSLPEATSSFVVERLFEQIMRLAALGGTVVYGVGLAVTPGTAVGGLLFVLLAFGAILWLVRHREATLAKGPRWLARLPRVTEAGARRALADLLDNLSQVAEPRRLALILFWSLATWTCFWAFFYCSLLALDNFLPAQRLAISLGALALSPPSAATQPGLFHASIVAPLAAVGFAPEPLTAYAVILHILEMIWMVGLALWGVTQTGFSLRHLLARKPPQSSITS